MSLFDAPIPAAEEVSTQGTAVLSPCRTWRYRLERSTVLLTPAPPTVAFVMLNPSTADESTDDPTVRRCWGFARAWHFDRLVVGNLFAFRSPSPNDLNRADDPIGPENDAHLDAIVADARLVLCAWGVHGALKGRGDWFAARYAATGKLHALDWTMGGEPNHPLYLPAHLAPRPWSERPTPRPRTKGRR